MLYVTRKHGRSLVNFIPCKSRFHSFSLSAFGPKATRRGEQMSSLIIDVCPITSFPLFFFEKGTAVLLVRVPVLPLKLVGRLLFRLTIGGHIFMVWNFQYSLYNRMWERDNKVLTIQHGIPMATVSQRKVPTGVKARCFPPWCKILCWWMGRLILRNGPRSPEQIDLCSNPSHSLVSLMN